MVKSLAVKRTKQKLVCQIKSATCDVNCIIMENGIRDFTKINSGTTCTLYL